MQPPANTTLDPALLATLRQQVTECLRSHPDGISEHVLIKLLRARADSVLPQGSLSDPLNLFCVHFLLFHTLYRLRDVFRQQQEHDLRIHPLLIQLDDYVPGESGVAREDPLRTYYLDLEILTQATTESVEELLQQARKVLITDQERTEALRALGLDAYADDDQARQRFRELAMLHHPDRGGDAETFRKIRAAMEVLGGGGRIH